MAGFTEEQARQAVPDAALGAAAAAPEALGDGVAAVTANDVVPGEGAAEGSGEQPDLAAQLAAARDEAVANYDRFLRAAAELDNLRKRTAKVRSETREEALRETLLRLAPVLDNLTRAQAQQTDDAAAVRRGVELIVGQFRDALRGFGLEEIAALGRPFDPNVHEALLEVPTNDHPPGTVIDQMDQGYTLNGKVIRPARVVVSKPME
jgi:molecular chaperone GrpE